jgi:hypothetical protein
MFRAGHRIIERIYQTAQIVFCNSVTTTPSLFKKCEKQMAAALGVPGDLNGLIQDALRSPELTAEIDRILADLLIAKAAKEPEPVSPIGPRGFKRELLNLADQYLSLHRERPLLIPGAVQGDPIFEEITDIPEVDTIDLSWMPPELQALAAEMLADED